MKAAIASLQASVDSRSLTQAVIDSASSAVDAVAGLDAGSKKMMAAVEKARNAINSAKARLVMM